MAKKKEKYPKKIYLDEVSMEDDLFFIFNKDYGPENMLDDHEVKSLVVAEYELVGTKTIRRETKVIME